MENLNESKSVETSNENVEENVTLNGKAMSKDEFESEKKSLIEKKIQIVETGKNSYTTRMLD